MKPDTWTGDQFNSMLALILRNLRISGAAEVAATPIETVAAECGFAPTSLLKACRADLVEHVHFGDGRAMTPSQIEKFLVAYSRGGKLAAVLNDSRPAPRNDMDEARKRSLKTAGRKPRGQVA